MGPFLCCDYKGSPESPWGGTERCFWSTVRCIPAQIHFWVCIASCSSVCTSSDILCPLLLTLPCINLPEAEMPFYSCSFCRMSPKYLLFLSQGHQTGVTFVPHLCLGLELCFILSWIPPFPLHWSTAGDLLSLHSGTCLVLPHEPPTNISDALVFSRPAQVALIYSKFP